LTEEGQQARLSRKSTSNNFPRQAFSSICTMNRPNARKRLNLDDRVESITDSDTSEFPLENEISDEYIKYHSKPTEQLDGELTNAESTKFAIPPSREGDERKESGYYR
jgi:hypothetical protein